MTRTERPSQTDLLLLTRAQRDRRAGMELIYWGTSEAGPVRVVVRDQRAVFFMPRDIPTQAGERRSVGLVTMGGQPVDAVYFNSARDRRDEADRLRECGTWPHESDVRPEDRFLMERFVRNGIRVRGTATQRDGYIEYIDPELTACDARVRPTVLSFDIETVGFDGPVLSIACTGHGGPKIWIASDQPAPAGVICLASEVEVLRAFIAYIAHADPDVLLGWNVIDFDLLALEERCRVHGVQLSLGRGGRRAHLIPARDRRRGAIARIPGRIVLDGIAMLQTATWRFERYSLDHVAHQLLGRGKTIDDSQGIDKVEEILRLHREDLAALAHYNLEDTRLVLEIFEAADLLNFALERQRLTGLSLDRRAGAVASFDYLYLPRLHREGHVAPDTGSTGLSPSSPGGYVMDSAPGLYRNVLVLDFKSLYPSLIRTFLVDPLGLAVATADGVPGFDGAVFDRERHIVPSIIADLWAARDEAKKRDNQAMSRAIKILMNSFYGVLGTPLCRFFDARLASSITKRGHQVLRESRRAIEDRGYPVIYGDTDSLFVHVGDATAEACDQLGKALSRDLTQWWTDRIRDEYGLPSTLELEFETHYARFLMPTMRHSTEGTKKRYAGLVTPDLSSPNSDGGPGKLVCKGLEAVRTDWTQLAREFQRELLTRVFNDQPYREWIRQVSDQLFAGELDDKLVYRKRLRRSLDDYTKTSPPHVTAARLLERTPPVIAYVITVHGPQPVGYSDAALDYDHYLKKQLEPAADVVLPFLGTDFARLGGRQLQLF